MWCTVLCHVLCSHALFVCVRVHVRESARMQHECEQRRAPQEFRGAYVEIPRMHPTPGGEVNRWFPEYFGAISTKAGDVPQADLERRGSLGEPLDVRMWRSHVRAEGVSLDLPREEARPGVRESCPVRRSFGSFPAWHRLPQGSNYGKSPCARTPVKFLGRATLPARGHHCVGA